MHCGYNTFMFVLVELQRLWIQSVICYARYSTPSWTDTQVTIYNSPDTSGIQLKRDKTISQSPLIERRCFEVRAFRQRGELTGKTINLWNNLIESSAQRLKDCGTEGGGGGDLNESIEKLQWPGTRPAGRSLSTPFSSHLRIHQSFYWPSLKNYLFANFLSAEQVLNLVNCVSLRKLVHTPNNRFIHSFRYQEEA